MKDVRVSDVRARLTFLQFCGVYAASLVVGVGAAVALRQLTGIDSLRFLFAYFALGFAFAAWGQPWWWSATLRSAGWFAVLPNRVLTVLFTIIAVLAAAAAVLP